MNSVAAGMCAHEGVGARHGEAAAHTPLAGSAGGCLYVWCALGIYMYVCIQPQSPTPINITYGSRWGVSKRPRTLLLVLWCAPDHKAGLFGWLID